MRARSSRRAGMTNSSPAAASTRGCGRASRAAFCTAERGLKSGATRRGRHDVLASGPRPGVLPYVDLQFPATPRADLTSKQEVALREGHAATQLNLNVARPIPVG